MPVSRPRPLPPPPSKRTLRELAHSRSAVTCKATNYPAGSVIDHHHHHRHQLVHAASGVLLVRTNAGQWIVPPTRALWMPAGLVHAVDCIGPVQMRSIYVRPDAAPGLARPPHVVGISPLLRELIRAAIEVPQPYVSNSRDGRLMRLLLDELRALPVLPLHLPQPSDPRLRQICDRLSAHPDDPSTLSDWGVALDIDRKTIERLFNRELGMTFGRWRQQLRLLRALERLARGDRIVDIALDLGYDSPGAFATMFRRQFGQSPSRFFEPVDAGNREEPSRIPVGTTAVASPASPGRPIATTAPSSSRRSRSAGDPGIGEIARRQVDAVVEALDLDVAKLRQRGRGQRQ